MDAIFRTVVAFFNWIRGYRQEEEERSHAAIHEEPEKQFICEYGFDEDNDDDADYEGSYDSAEEHEDTSDYDEEFDEEFISNEEFEDNYDEFDDEDENSYDEFDDEDGDEDYDEDFEYEGGTVWRQPQPITLDMLEKKTVMTEDERVCAICLEDMEVGEEAGVMECSHMFHQVCLLRWLSNKRSCPVCRSMVFTSLAP